MSLFESTVVPCPSCGAPVEFLAVVSVNADRRPDLRLAILDGTFQQQPCGKCKHTFRMDPAMNFLDIGRGLWIAVYPLVRLGSWADAEAEAEKLFADSYGPQSSAGAQEIGRGLTARAVFGWGALREKILAFEHELDDVTLELTKMALLQSGATEGLTDETELRYLNREKDQLEFGWVVASTEELVDGIQVPVGLYDEIHADRVGWKALRAELTGRFFVDMNRMMIESAPAAAE